MYFGQQGTAHARPVQAKRTELHRCLKREGWPPWQSEAVTTSGQASRSQDPHSAVAAIRVAFQPAVRPAVLTGQAQ